MQQVITELREAGIAHILEHEPLAAYTTWNIGGPADLLLIPESAEQLAAAMRILHRSGTPWTLLGRGSNTLVSDKGVRGAVIKLGKSFEEVRFDGGLVYVGGAFSLIKLSVMARKQGLTGLEFASGGVDPRSPSFRRRLSGRVLMRMVCI